MCIVFAYAYVLTGKTNLKNNVLHEIANCNASIMKTNLRKTFDWVLISKFVPS
jgi:hypothetical protein